MKSKCFISGLLLLFSFSVAGAGQDAVMELEKQVLISQKKLAITKNMNLSDAEASAFWPVFDSYQDRLIKVGIRTGKLIERYAGVYQSLTNSEADKLITEYLETEAARLELKQEFLPKFQEVLSAKKVMRYYQIENKLEALARYKLVDIIPLAK